MIRPIRLYGDPVLRRAARDVRDFGSDLAELAEDMIETMHDARGVGLAAPQVGVSLRLFIALELAAPTASADDATDSPTSAEDTPDEEANDESDVVATHVMVNPRITERSGTQVAPDGCLSIPGLWVEDMVRDDRVVVTYQDLRGEHHKREAVGHFAHVIQHELDHLDGVLYFDRLPELDRRAFLEAHRKELAELQRKSKAMLKELRAEATAAP